MANNLSSEISRSKLYKNQNKDGQNQPHSRVRVFWRNVLAIILVGLLVWLCSSSIRIFLTYREARRNLIFAENQKVQIQNDIVELQKKIDQVKTGVGVEEHIRTKYPLVKEGERVLVINENEAVEPKTKTTRLASFLKRLRAKY